MSNTITDAVTPQDPKEIGPKPPQPEPNQPNPGSEAQMTIKPDYGEDSYKGSSKLQGRKAIITGGDSGIGRAVALAFAREGADVLIAYLPEEEEDAQTTKQIVEKEGRKCVTFPGDIGEPQHCEQMVQQAVSELGGLDILVNNAAYQKVHESFTEITPDELERTFRTNLFAMFYLSKAAFGVMQPGSAIVNTCSVQAYKPEPSLLAYAASKGAIVTFTKGLAQEGAEKGIRVNVVAPGPVWTPLIVSTMPPEKVKSFGQESPLKRAAQPAELAPVYVLLASQEASYITGMVYGVTGGTVLA